MNIIKLGCEKIYYGENAISGIKDFIGEKVFIVMSGDILKKQGLLDIVIKELTSKEVLVELFDEVEPEPSFETILKGAEKMKDFAPDWIIGFGGGSAMDAAKAMWVYYENPSYKSIDDVVKSNLIENLRAKAKLCCIPTSAGTGSEVTRAALIKDNKQKKKYSIRDINLRLIPDVAIIDAVFTESMPDTLISSSGMDAITHAIESYVCPLSNPFSKSLSLGSFIYGYKNIRAAYNLKTYEARSNMLAASCLGGISFSNSGLGIVHSIAHTFGAEFNIPHGLANAIILPYGIKYNSRDLNVLSQYKELASAVSEGSLYDAIVQLKLDINIPKCMKEIVNNDAYIFENINSLTQKALDDICTKFSPIEISFEEMKNLILEVYSGI